MVKVVSDTPFLVCGLPKSGTTFLQRTLDLHPQISCPSEQSFTNLSRIIQQALQNYAQVLNTFDRRTGGQGASRYGATIENEMLRAAIAVLSKSFSRGRPIHGLNDNSVFNEIERYLNLLSNAKIIGIVRNPVDVGLSIWRHSLWLAREEPKFADKHLAIIDNPKKTVEGMIELMLPSYRASVGRFLELAAARSNLHVVRYEQLVASKESELKRLLQFLDADASETILAKMMALSSRQAMAASSRNPDFFGLKGDDPHRVDVSRDFRRAALESAMSPRMQAIGYDVSALMVGR
jgi:hypothetical protein